MASKNTDLCQANSWGQFESLLLKHVPPQIPTASPVSPVPPVPFSFLSPLRLDDTISHLPAADYHLYGTHPMCRSSDLILCSECGQPVPPSSLSRHFDNSHSSPPQSPGIEVLELMKPPVCLPLQPSYKLNSNPPERQKIKKKKSTRPKEPAPLSPPVPLSSLKQETVLRPSKRFPSFLADSSQSQKSAKLDLQTKNQSFSFYSPSLPPALPFRHLPPLPGPLVFSPASSGPRLSPSGLLLTNRSADRMHFALSQVFTDSVV
ncbi:hypothetical protein LOD99_6853 [Oopsacas minuta]|uniref:Uncharacterized protein n=1 Tax=Oopsacas minuta TaxID=111878 RepID=A0AAV7JL38_9METZ|nr:hypothetical protein LOD99_6853 [Oopsacas minuta]